MTPEGDIISNGKVIANEFVLNSDGGSLGTGLIPAGEIGVVIDTSLVEEGAKILLTPSSDTSDSVIYVSEQIEGESFTVSISNPIDKDITFDWVLVGSYEQEPDNI